MSGLRFAPWEIALIEALDEAYLKPEPPVSAPDSGGKKLRSVSSSSDGEGVKSIMGSVGDRRVVVRTRKASTK